VPLTDTVMTVVLVLS